MLSVRQLPCCVPGPRGSKATGTTANEALHSQINEWFRNQSEIYSTTAELQLKVNVIGKLMTHNAALYRPTLRQLRQSEVLARVTPAIEQDTCSWLEYCDLLAKEGAGRLQPARLS